MLTGKVLLSANMRYAFNFTIDFDIAFDFPSPFAAADDEWINGDQQGELFEALAEFSRCRRSSFRHRVPA
jgi:hypothetical protein